MSWKEQQTLIEALDKALTVIDEYQTKTSNDEMRVKNAHREREVALQQLHVAIALLSTHPQFERKHP